MATILIVDDDDSLRATMAKALTRAGYHVQDVATGRAGLASALGGGVDLVITDVYMPDMDGIEFLTRLRHEAQPPKVIAMSGGGYLDAAGVLEIAQRLGAVRSLAKPFTIDDMVTAVREELGTRDLGR